MNEQLIIQKVKSYLNSNNELLYSDFDSIFCFLELKEQYEVSNFLDSIGIKLVDSKSIDDNYINQLPSRLNKKTIIVKKKYTKNKNRNKHFYFNESNEYLVELYQKTNNQQILQILITKNEKYIYQLIQKCSFYYSHNIEEEDLHQIAVIGFIKGCQRFDCNKGYNLLTYVTFWIRQILNRQIMDIGFLIRLPVHVWEKIKKLGKKFDEDFLFEIKDDKLYEDYTKIMLLKKIYLNPEYLDSYINNDNQNIKIIDTISNITCLVNKVKQPEEYLAELELRDTVKMALCHLSPREQGIIISRFALEGEEKKTLEEIGENFGITRERIRQLEVKSLKKIKRALTLEDKNGIRDLLETYQDSEKIFYPEYNFKKNGISYIPDIYTIIRRIIKLNPNENNYDVLYTKVLKCSVQNSYGITAFSKSDLVKKIMKIKEENHVRNN